MTELYVLDPARTLADLESDTHMHIHLENNVLFPAALAEPV